MKALVFIATLFALSGAASAAPEGSARPFTMERTATWTMESAQGTTYRLYVHTPEAPPPEAGYPGQGRPLVIAGQHRQSAQNQLDARTDADGPHSSMH